MPLNSQEAGATAGSWKLPTSWASQAPASYSRAAKPPRLGAVVRSFVEYRTSTTTRRRESLQRQEHALPCRRALDFAPTRQAFRSRARGPLQLQLHLSQMRQANPVGQCSQASAPSARSAPRAHGHRQWKLDLARYHFTRSSYGCPRPLSTLLSGERTGAGCTRSRSSLANHAAKAQNPASRGRRLRAPADRRSAPQVNSGGFHWGFGSRWTQALIFAREGAGGRERAENDF